LVNNLRCMIKCIAVPGATKEIRTLDLAFTKRLLYRLSYGGKS
jgi:hypothetical protein